MRQFPSVCLGEGQAYLAQTSGLSFQPLFLPLPYLGS